MPAVTIAPSTEACEAIRDRINSGGAYTLAVNATIAEQFSDDQQAMTDLMVDVVALDEEQIDESLDVENRASVQIGIEIRRKLESDSQALVDAMKLLVRQIFQRVNNFDSSNRRVRVWECGTDENENPNKELLTNGLIFRSRLLLRVEVEPPA